ncbi:MAG: hypothetical protein IIC09_04160 [Proteobacteria bacterium]|nr:hypothetical protein [Pseudomonadota bacterium]
MQTYERTNLPPQRGHKLRYEEGHDEKYSAELDYEIGATSLNDTPRMSEDEQHPTTAKRKLRGETGLIMKEPLS